MASLGAVPAGHWDLEQKTPRIIGECRIIMRFLPFFLWPRAGGDSTDLKEAKVRLEEPI